MRTGTVQTAVRVPKSRLLHLSVSFGELGERSVLAGIGEQFTPENMIGKSILCVANLPPREMKGIMSNAMLTAVKSADGKLTLVGAQDAPAGLQVG